VTVDTFDDAEFGSAGAWRDSVSRFLRLSAWTLIVLGPIVAGGSLGWWLTAEVGRDATVDALLRDQSAAVAAGVPLVSKNEIEAAGLSIEDTQAILNR